MAEETGENPCREAPPQPGYIRISTHINYQQRAGEWRKHYRSIFTFSYLAFKILRLEQSEKEKSLPCSQGVTRDDGSHLDII